MTMKNRCVPLKWMEEPAQYIDGHVLGIPFEQGEMAELPSATWQANKVQTWPMAYWPDGSIKWMGAGFSEMKGIPAPEVELTDDATDAYASMIEETSDTVVIDTNKLRMSLNKSGSVCIESVTMESSTLVNNGRLMGVVETYEETSTCRITRQYSLESEIHQVIVEQDGPIRSVVKVDGCHRIEGDQEEVLPFSLRIIAYRQSEQVEIKHTLIYDLKETAFFIKGIGMTFEMPLKGANYNKQVKFAGDTGMFTENCRWLSTRIKNYSDVFRQQVEGEQFPTEEEADYVQDMAVWNHYKLRQKTSDTYEIVKRTGKDCSYITCDHGKRSKGSLCVRDEEKGILIGVKDFWQKGPMMLEVDGLASDKGTIQVWFWSPDEDPMDMRHYDTTTHVLSSYEGAKKLDATPYGIANTHEIRLIGVNRQVDDGTLFGMSQEIQTVPRLQCLLERYHKSKALGIYSMKATAEVSSPKRKDIEEQLEKIIDFYIQEVEQRKWYGCWNYGDVMHTYDQVRHKWRYDIGGYAWQNTELAPNIWLWFSYLRSGDARIFRMAEAMTRHTSEVDMYHKGPYKGLGSRHNVSHWGCGAKEPRIAMAGLHRFYYYLTCDERIGDIMNEVTDADFSTLNKDPMREYYGEDSFATHARSGPDWVAYVSNWYTAYERTGKSRYLNKIMQGVDSLYKMPHRLLSGSCFGYTPEDGRLHYMGEATYGYHLAICMGGPQVWMEIVDLLPDDRLKRMVIEFGAFYFLTHQEKIEKTADNISDNWDWPMFATGISAYASRETKNQALALKTWQVLLGEEHRCIQLPVTLVHVKNAHMIAQRQEIEQVTTNTMSQWSINAIVCLELIGDDLEAYTGDEGHEE